MKLSHYILSFIFCVVIASVALSQSAGDFRSFQTGNWSDTASWERYNGATWVNPAPNVPTAVDGAITILEGHTITVDADTTVDQVTVNATGTILVAATKRLSIADGADSVDMVVYGSVNQFGTITATGRISIENGGLLTYSIPAGGDIPMPVYTWRTGSTIRIDSTTGTTPTNLKNQTTLYNVIWNGTASGANGGPNFNDATHIYGSLTLLSSKKFQWRVTNLSGGQIKNIYIHGNVNVMDTSSLLTSTGSGADTLAKAIINVDGNVNVTAGTWSLCNSGSAYAEWKIKGNISITGGSLTSGASGWAGRRTINFCGGTTQTFTLTAPATMSTAPTTFKVSNGSTVQIGFPFPLLSTSMLSLESGTFVTTSTNLITIPAAGNIIGGSASSYVDGPLAVVVASISATTKTLPIGKGGFYRPVVLTVNQDAATATTYTAEMFNSAPTTRTLPASLLSVSDVRYYTITKGAGANLSPTLGATVQLNYDATDLMNNATMIRIAKDNGVGNWLNLGGSGTADTTGSITSNAFFSFSDFVLAIADTNVAAAPPTVTTTAESFVSTTFATSGGNVTNDGGGAVTGRGVCWNTTGSPTISDSMTSNGTGAGVFTSHLTGLIPGATYFLRAYATNNAGTGYGNEITFTTLASIIPPTVTTTAISNIQVTTAVSGGNVTNWGGDSVIARGICWNTSGTPSISGSHSIDGSNLGSYISGMSLLTGGTLYYVRAYATNSSGVGYGNEITFTTQTPQPDTTVIVAQDGSGNYLTVQAAFRAVPSNYTGKWTIFVKRGIYYEKDTLASGKINVTLIGEDRDSTIITYDDYADSHGSGVPGTSGSFTIAIDASDFTAKNITFRNTYSPQPGVTGTQAVALRTQGDRHEYINCKILGYQDTYYTWGGNGTGRMYHRNCYIEGTVDFIFGRNIVVFDSCTIREIRNAGALTAGSTDPSSKYGYVFRNCTILADSIGYDGNPITTFYLGRPWQASPRTEFINSYEPSNLNSGGWLSWNVTPGLYSEFNCFGPGSPTGSRVSWSSQLTGTVASTYSLSTIYAKSSATSNLILYDWMPVNAMSDEPLIYRITSTAGTNGAITPSGISNVANNGSKYFSVTPASGYFVDSLFVDGGAVTPDSSYMFTNVTANRTLSAVLALSVNTTITATAGANGSLSPSGAVAVLQGSNQRFTVSPDPGYHVESVTVDSVPVDSVHGYTFHYVTVPHTIHVTFALTKTFTLTVNALHGSVVKNPDAAVYDTATVVQLTAIADAGYHFTGWSGDIDTISNPFFITMNSDKIITANFAQDTVTVWIHFNAGWNLVSLPVTAVDARKSSVFPTAISSAFSYSDGYSIEDTLRNNVGYWLKFSRDTTIAVKGYVRFSDTIVVKPGWNLIGTISCDVAVNTIEAIPRFSSLGIYYGYNNGYLIADILRVGHGYWMKALSDGMLVLSCSPARTTSQRSDKQTTITGRSTLGNFSTLTINDAKGNTQTLNIGGEKQTDVPISYFEMPPSAPSGGFDVRFASQRMAEVYGASSSMKFPIELQSVEYPVTVSWNVADNDAEFNLHAGNSLNRTITGKGSLTIKDATVKEIILGVSSGELPTGFSLLQNYPNPFNPETNIKFSVEVIGQTTLDVYNILGQKVVTLFNDIAEPGHYYHVSFNANNYAGGLFYYRLQSNDKSDVKPMMFVK